MRDAKLFPSHVPMTPQLKLSSVGSLRSPRTAALLVMIGDLTLWSTTHVIGGTNWLGVKPGGVSLMVHGPAQSQLAKVSAHPCEL